MYSVHEPSDKDNEQYEEQGSLNDLPDHPRNPTHGASMYEHLRKFVIGGSCATGVAVLYFLSGWGFGWIPGIESPFARASDVSELTKDVSKLYIMQLGQTIRALQDDLCAATRYEERRRIEDQLDEKQLEYQQRTRQGRYPDRPCPRG